MPTSDLINAGLFLLGVPVSLAAEFRLRRVGTRAWSNGCVTAAGAGLVILVVASPVAALAAAPADFDGPEQAWHRCGREAYAHRPAGQRRAGDERNAPDACKAREDADMAAVMAGRPGDDDRPLRALSAEVDAGSAKESATRQRLKSRARSQRDRARL